MPDPGEFDPTPPFEKPIGEEGAPIGGESEQVSGAAIGGSTTTEPGAPIGPAGEVFAGAGPIGSEGAPGSGGAFIAAPGVLPGRSALTLTPVEVTAGQPISGPQSIFNIGGAPIAVLGGVFSGGLPIGGPVTQIFRGGSGPEPNTLFIATISPSGPIATFFIGSGGSPIGEATFGGGALPIGGPEAAFLIAQRVGARTALVSEPAVAIGGGQVQESVPPIGEAMEGLGGLSLGGLPVGGPAAEQPAGEIGPRHAIGPQPAEAFGGGRTQRPAPPIGAA